MLYYDQDTYEFQHQISLAKYRYLFNLQFQPCTHNLLLYDWAPSNSCLSDEKTILATIKNNNNIESFMEKGLCCLPNGDICALKRRINIFDSSGRFLSAFGSDDPKSSRLCYPRDICYLDRWMLHLLQFLLYF